MKLEQLRAEFKKAQMRSQELRKITPERMTESQSNELRGLVVLMDSLKDEIDTEMRLQGHGNGGTGATGNTGGGSGPFTNFGEQLRAVINADRPGGHTDSRLYDVRAVSGMSEGVAADGGWLVQEDFSTSLIKGLFDTGKLAGMCTRFGLGEGKNGIKLPVPDETSRANGSRWGGVQIFHAGEAVEATKSKPKFASLRLKLEKLIGLVYLTDELLEDVPMMEQFVSMAFFEEFDYKMDDIIINGLGAGQGLGIMNSDALVTVPKEDGQEAGSIYYENILNMWTRMPARCRKTAVWLINQDAETQLFKMHMVIGTGGVPVYLPATQAAGSTYSTLFTRPVLPVEQCQSVGSKGDIILFDPKSYVFIDKGGIKKDFSMHVRFLYDEGVLRFVYRYDSQPVFGSAITPANGTNTLSPYVTLAARE